MFWLPDLSYIDQGAGAAAWAAGSVGSAVAPALSTTAVVIMLIPLRLTSLFGPKSMKNKAAVPTTAMTAAAVTGTRFPRLSSLWACISLLSLFGRFSSYFSGRNKFQQTSPPADIPEKPPFDFVFPQERTRTHARPLLIH